MDPASIDGDKYAIAVLDDASGGVWTELMRTKSRVPQSIKTIMEAAEKKTGHQVVTVRSDRAKEYMCKELKDYYSTKGISHQPTPPYSPESNGRAERLNRTVVEKARAILEELHILTGMSDYRKLWSEAVLTVVYGHNRTLTKSTHESLRGKTPYEIVTGMKPDLSYLRIFGCKVKVKKPKRYLKGKFDSKVWDGIHVGYDGAEGAYRIYIQHLNRIFVSRDVTFLEKLFRPIVSDQSVTSGTVISDSDSEPDVSTIEKFSTGTESEQHPERSIAKDRPRRVSKAPDKYGGFAMLSFLTVHEINNHSDREPPQTFEEALNCQEKEMSADAMSEEWNHSRRIRCLKYRNWLRGVRKSSGTGSTIAKGIQRAILFAVKPD